MSSHSSHHPQEVLLVAYMCTKVASSPIHLSRSRHANNYLILFGNVIHYKDASKLNAYSNLLFKGENLKITKDVIITLTL